MKKRNQLFALLSGMFLALVSNLSQAQVVNYNISNLVVNGGNPGNLNTDVDDLAHTTANGFTELLAGGALFPQYSTIQSLPIPFKFNGKTVTQFVVAPSGVLSFDTAYAGKNTAPTNGGLNSLTMPTNGIAGFWSKWTSSPPSPATAKVYGKVYGTAPNRQYWIDFYGMKLGAATNVYFSIVLEEGTNNIYVVDKNLWTGTNLAMTAGIKISATKYFEVPGSPNLTLGTGTNAVSDNDYYTFSPSVISTYLQTVGTGTSNNTRTSQPTPYAASTWGNRLQMLIRKSEMPGLDSTPILNSLAFNVATLAGNALAGYTIKLKNVSDTSLTSYITGATQVYSTVTYVDVAGWNTHYFDNPFQWDTTKNLLVEVCFSNSSAINNGNAIVNSTNTGFNATLYNAANAVGLCNSKNVVGTTQLRPNMQINGVYAYTDLLAPSVTVTSSTTNGCIAAPRVVTATISDNDTVSSAQVKYSFDNGVTFTSLAMSNTSGNIWTTTIPAAGAGQSVQFFVLGFDRNNNVNTPDTLNYRDQYLYLDLGPDQAITAGSSITIGPNGGQTPGAELKITEVVMNAATGRGAQTTAPAAYIPWANTTDLVEIMNTGKVSVNMQGYVLKFLSGFQNFNYTFPALTLAPGEIAIVANGNGTDSLPVRFVRTNNNFNLNNGGAWGLALFTKNNKVMDAMANGNYQFAATSGVSSSDWAGNLTTPAGGGGTGWCAWIRNYSDKNDNTDWAVSDTTTALDRTSVGVLNPKLVLATDNNKYAWHVVGNATVIDTNSVTTVSPTTNTYYALTVSDKVCSFTDTILVSIITYCEGASNNINTYISNTKVANIDTNTNVPTSGYSLSSKPVINLVRGSQRTPIQVTPKFTNGQKNVYTKAWVDYNKDGDMNDAGEEVFSAGPDTVAMSGVFSVPTSAITGITRFRVALQADSFPTICDTIVEGEVEDYLANILDAKFDQDPPVVVSLDAVASGCTPSDRLVGAVISDNYGVDSAFLSYSVNNGATYTNLSMNYQVSSGKWEATIPAVSLGTTVLYYVSAYDFNKQFSGNSASKKYTDGISTVYAGTDTVVAPNGKVLRVAKTTLSNITISEVLFNRGSAGTQTTFDPSLPQNGNADMIEVTNYGTYANDLSGFTANLYYTGFGGPGGGTLNTISKTLPAGTILGPGKQMIFVLGAGADNAAANVYYLSATGPGFVDMSSFGAAGFAMMDTSGNPLDVVAFNNITFPTSKITSADWKGNVAIPANGPTAYAGVTRVGTSDHNDSTDWVPSNAGNLSTIAAGTPGLTLSPATMKWTISGNSAVVSSNDTLQVTVGSTTNYVVTLTSGSCSSTDSILVEVDSSITNMTALNVENVNANCNLTSNEPVRFTFKNNGATAVDFSVKNALVTLNHFDGTNTTTITDTIKTGILNVGDTATHIFGNINLSTGKTYTLSAWVNVTGDRVDADDTTNSVLKSEAFSVNAGVDQTVVLGQNTQIQATSTFKKIIISEVLQSTTSAGIQTTFPAAFGNVAGTLTDMFEIANITGMGTSIAGYSLNFYGLTQTTDYTYTFPAGAIINGNSVVSYLTNNGTNDPTNGVYFRNTGSPNTNTANNNDAFGVVLKDASGNIVDVVATNGYVFPISSGVTSADWGGGNTANAGTAGIQRFGVDNNKVTDWLADNATRTSTMGTLQAGLTSPIGTFSWAVLNGVSLGSTNPQTVAPTAPTYYVASLNNGICTVTDTMHIAIDSNAVDFVALAVGNIKAACQYSANDTVYLRLKNASAQPIDFSVKNLNATLKVNTTTYNVTRNSGISNPNDTFLVMFTGVNLASPSGVTNFSLQSWAKVAGDAFPKNDTVNGKISSEKLGVFAGNDVVIPPGGNFSLQSKASNRVRFSEFVWITTAGTNGLQTTAPAGVTNWGNAQYDYIEIANTGYNNMDLSGYTFNSFVTGGRPGQVNYTYTIPNGTVLAAGSALILSTDTGTNGNGVLFMGRNTVDNYNSGGRFGLVLKDPASNVVDAVATGGFAFAFATTGVKPSEWKGNIAGGVGSAGVKRVVEDSDSSSDWVACNSAATVTTLGTVQYMTKNYLSWSNAAGTLVNNTDTVTGSSATSTYYIASYSNGVCSVVDTVNVIVNNTIVDAKALFPRLVNPACTLGANESVDLYLLNSGATAINFANTPISASLTAGFALYSGTLNTGVANPLDTIKIRINNVNLSGIGAFPATAKMIFSFTMSGDANATNNTSDSTFVGNKNNVVTASALSYTLNYGSSTKVYATAPGALKITEIIPNATGLGSQDSTTIPTGFPWTFNKEMIELTNLGMGNYSTAGDTLYVAIQGGGPGINIAYPLPSLILEPGANMVIVSDTGTNNPAIGLYYLQAGGVNPLRSTSNAGFYVRNTGVVKDAVAMNNYTFTAASGVTASDWSGPAINSANRAGIFRLAGDDNNKSTDWIGTDTLPNRRSSIGALNPNVIVPMAIFNWFNPNGQFIGTGDSLSVTPGDTTIYTVSLNYGVCAATDTVKVNVIPSKTTNDMQAVRFVRSGNAPVNTPQTIQVEFKNNGKPVKSFIAAFSVNNTIVTIDTVTFASSLWPDSSYVHTFRSPWIPGTQVTNQVCAYASIAADVNLLNDTTCTTYYSSVGTKDMIGTTLQVYPNPTSGVLLIQLNNQSINRVVVSDIQGRKLINQSDVGLNHLYQLDVTSLPQGTYMLETYTNEGRKVNRFVKE